MWCSKSKKTVTGLSSLHYENDFMFSCVANGRGRMAFGNSSPFCNELLNNWRSLQGLPHTLLLKLSFIYWTALSRDIFNWHNCRIICLQYHIGLFTIVETSNINVCICSVAYRSAWFAKVLSVCHFSKLLYSTVYLKLNKSKIIFKTTK